MAVMRRQWMCVAAAVVMMAGACSDGDQTGSDQSGSEQAKTTTSVGALATTTPTTTPTTTTMENEEGAVGGSPASTASVATAPPVPIPADQLEVVSFPVPAGSRPHDVAPATDGGVWYTAQRSGELGYLDPATGVTRHVSLGEGSAPHGVIVGPEGLVWITDGGLNAIISVDPATDEVTRYPLPADVPNANLNTAAFDGGGRLWFTGQNGVHGVLDLDRGELDVFSSPRGAGPYGIAATPEGQIYYASLAGSYIGFVNPDGSVIELEPPTAGQGARRVWADSTGAIWVSEWNSGQLSRYVADDDRWDVWPLPGAEPTAYAVYVDETDQVWVSDFGGNAIHRFDPETESFDTFALPANPSNVRQLLGRPGEVWGAESANDSLVVIRPAG